VEKRFLWPMQKKRHTRKTATRGNNSQIRKHEGGCEENLTLHLTGEVGRGGGTPGTRKEKGHRNNPAVGSSSVKTNKASPYPVPQREDADQNRKRSASFHTATSSPKRGGSSGHRDQYKRESIRHRRREGRSRENVFNRKKTRKTGKLFCLVNRKTKTKGGKECATSG